MILNLISSSSLLCTHCNVTQTVFWIDEFSCLNHPILMIWCSRNISRKQFRVAVFEDFFSFKISLMNRKFIEIFDINVKVFTVNFDQSNASLLNKSIHFFKTKSYWHSVYIVRFTVVVGFNLGHSRGWSMRHIFISEFHWHCDHWAVIINIHRKKRWSPLESPLESQDSSTEHWQ